MRIRALLVGLIMTFPILQQPQLFRFEDNFWINLHHFLYVLGRAKASTPDSQRRAVVEAPREVASASLPEADRNTWNDAVMFYERTLSKQDAVFDNQLVSITNALSRSNDALSANNGLDPALGAILDHAAPVYRKYWYPQHAASNARAVRTLNDLLERYGNGIMRRITKAYGQGWPSGGVLVQISGYSNWAGAYSTNGPLLVVSSTDSGNSGASALETIFHESMHQWDDIIETQLKQSASVAGVQYPPDLSHAMIFYTAGYAVQREIGDNYVPYAEANGLWRQRGMGRFKKPLDDHWRPYLDANGPLDEAIAAVLKAIPAANE